MDDDERFNVEYGRWSTAEMLRIARIVTPPEGTYQWAATYPGRCWKREGEDWVGLNKDGIESGHRYDDEFFRYLLGEQLWQLGVRSYSPVWNRY